MFLSSWSLQKFLSIDNNSNIFIFHQSYSQLFSPSQQCNMTMMSSMRGHVAGETAPKQILSHSFDCCIWQETTLHVCIAVVFIDWHFVLCVHMCWLFSCLLLLFVFPVRFCCVVSTFNKMAVVSLMSFFPSHGAKVSIYPALQYESQPIN